MTRQGGAHSGLPAPGDRSLFKVYMINTDDRGKGSNVVDIRWLVG